VKIHRGPAAVIGDERHFISHSCQRACDNVAGINGAEKAMASRMIRKPENLPVIAVRVWRFGNDVSAAACPPGEGWRVLATG